MLRPTDERALVPEERHDAPEGFEAQEPYSHSHSHSHDNDNYYDDWEMVDEDVGDSSTLTAPRLEAPTADNGPALMTAPSAPFADTGSNEADQGPAANDGHSSMITNASHFGPGPAPSIGPEPSYTFGPDPYSDGPESSPANSGPSSFGEPSSTGTFGLGLTPFGREPSSTESVIAGPGPSPATVHTTIPIYGPGLSSFGPGPSSESNDDDPNLGPGPSDIDGYEQTILSPEPSSDRAPNLGPGPLFFGPGPSDIDRRETTILSPGPSSDRAPNLGPVSTSFGPGPADNNPTMGPGSFSSFGPGPSFDGESSTGVKEDPSLHHPSPIRAISFTSFSPGPSELPFGPGPISYFDPGTTSFTVDHSSVKKNLCKRFLCAPCNKGFNSIEHLERHKATSSHANKLATEGIMSLDPLPSLTVSCPFCHRTFNRRDNLRPHLLRHMGGSGNLTRTRQVSVEESIGVGLAHIDPRCAQSS